MILRFAGLKVVPSARTVSRWLKRFNRHGVEALRRLNAEVVAATVSRKSELRTPTIDVDGTVLSTGMKVERAFCGYNCGRGSHEKIIGDLKPGLAFDSIPSNHYGANSPWQQIVALAHNLLVNLQIEGGAKRCPRSRKGTAVFLLRRAGTFRFVLFNRAGHLVRPHGATRLRLLANERVKNAVLRMVEAMGKQPCALTH